MNRKVLVSAVAALVLGLSIVPRSTVLCDGFLPPNDMLIAVDSPEAKGIGEKEFNAVLDQIQSIYGPIVAAKGGKLQINRLWSNGTVNASAQRSGSTYIINMYGGLARHEVVTQDGFAVVACHEMGHHLGGAPKVSNWASNEGQSDYFANLKCMRLLFGAPGAASFTRMNGDDEVAQAACAKSYAKPADQAICLRSANAAMSVSTLLKILRKEPKPLHFDTPDTNVVAKTDDRHPAPQCRLDTYFAAALCTRPLGDILDDINPAVGTCTGPAGFTAGLRPLCWYKPVEKTGRARVAMQRPAPQTPALAVSLSQTDLWKGF
jgi:hypothetical protein